MARSLYRSPRPAQLRTFRCSADIPRFAGRATARSRAGLGARLVWADLAKPHRARPGVGAKPCRLVETPDAPAGPRSHNRLPPWGEAYPSLFVEACQVL